MMIRTIAKLKSASVSPQKARLVTHSIVNQNVKRALAILEFTNKKAARLILKVLRSSIANAVHNCKLNENNLYVKRAFADQGPTAKRFKLKSRNTKTTLKRTSHICVEVAEFAAKL